MPYPGGLIALVAEGHRPDHTIGSVALVINGDMNPTVWEKQEG